MPIGFCDFPQSLSFDVGLWFEAAGFNIQPATNADIFSIFVSNFQAHIASIGRSIEAMLLEWVGKKTREGKNFFQKFFPSRICFLHNRLKKHYENQDLWQKKYAEKRTFKYLSQHTRFSCHPSTESECFTFFPPYQLFFLPETPVSQTLVLLLSIISEILP